MARKCALTGKAVMSGNNVSHAVNRTRRRFLPNLQNVKLQSELLKRSFRLKISTAALRTLDSKGGLDGFLLNTSKQHLSPIAQGLQKQIKKIAPSSK